MTRINVTKTFLPPLGEYEAYLAGIWERSQLTNQGPLLHEFESRVSRRLGVSADAFNFVTNGTVALQLAIKALGLEGGEVITTPFSYVARRHQFCGSTANLCLWMWRPTLSVSMHPK